MTATRIMKSLIGSILVLVVAGIGSMAFAAPPTVSIVPVNDLVNGGTVAGASSKIIRTDKGITVSVNTTVNPGTYTMWLLVWNNPENCHGNPAVPGLRCIPGPPPEYDPPSCVFFGTGHVVGENGVLNYTAHQKTWDPAGSIGGACPNGLTNPRGADVHAAVRTHGEKISGMIDAQIHTVGGGCGENDCLEIQAAPHEEPLP